MQAFLNGSGYLDRRAFTLIEVAIVLIILGLLLGFGAGLVGILTKKVKYTESKEEVRRTVEALKGYAIRFGVLPPPRPFASYNSTLPDPAFNITGVRGYDAQNKALLYVAAPELVTSSRDFCSLNSTSLQITDQGSPRINLAFLVVSAGPNYNLQTQYTVYQQGKPNVDDFPYDFNRAEEYDDIVQYVSLFELQQQRCNYSTFVYCYNLTVHVENLNSYSINGHGCNSGLYFNLEQAQFVEAYIGANCNNMCGNFTFTELISYDSNKNCKVKLTKQGSYCVPQDY